MNDVQSLPDSDQLPSSHGAFLDEYEIGAFVDGGEIGALINARNWSGTAIGPISEWPQSLRSTLDLVLASPVAMIVLWGPDFLQLYNEAFAVIAGPRHPNSLGQPNRECWPEIWEFNEPVYTAVMRGEKRSFKGRLLSIERQGVAEDAWFDLGYSALRDDSGAIAGVLVIVVETTSQVLAGRHIASQLQQQRQLFDKAPGFICIFNGPKHVYEFGNEAFTRLVGHRDFTGKPVRETLPEIEGQGFFQLLDTVYATGARYVGEHQAVRLLRTHGAEIETRYVDYIFEPIDDDAGHVTGIFIQGHDVTAAYLAREALFASEARLLALNADLEKQVIERTLARGQTWQLTPDLMGVLNAQGLFEASNPAWQVTLGWTEAELATTPIFDLTHPDDLAATRTVFDQLMRGEPVLLFENRHRRTDHTYRWLSWVAVPVGGKIYCSARDVTDQKAQATALSLTQANLRTLFETSNQLQGLLTPDGIVTDLNAASLDAIKARREDIVGRQFWETPWFTNTPDMPERVRAAVATAASGEDVHTEFSLNVAAGWRTYDVTLRPIRDARGNVIGINPEGVDITDQRQAEGVLRQHHKLEAMGQLTGGVAHDFNNLLTPIIGGLDLLRHHAFDDERASRLIDGAMQSAERARNLVQRLLAFARLQPLQSGPVDLAAVVTGMTDLITITCAPKVRLVVDLERNLSPAQADLNQIEMAILNLCVNARDAMPDGGNLTIAVAAETIGADHQPALTPGHYVRLTVTDTGSGMDEATRARAIEPFFSTKGVGEGTGLGLSTVHGLATQLGGGMTIASESGIGTTVTMWLPVSGEPAEA